MTIAAAPGARLPLKSLLYVPDPIPAIPELPMINFMRTIAGSGRTFVDVGSHIGFYTMGLAPGFARVIAFEPSRFQYGWLRRNSVAQWLRSRFSVSTSLSGSEAGTARLNVLSYEGGLNSLAPEVADGETILDHYTVPVEVLDDRGLTDVDLLKIDVEGFEVPVLRGAARTIAASRPVILIEVWEDVVAEGRCRGGDEGDGLQLRIPVPYVARTGHVPAERNAVTTTSGSFDPDCASDDDSLLSLLAQRRTYGRGSKRRNSALPDLDRAERVCLARALRRVLQSRRWKCRRQGTRTRRDRGLPAALAIRPGFSRRQSISAR